MVLVYYQLYDTLGYLIIDNLPKEVFCGKWALGISQDRALVARGSHNPKATGSIPVPAFDSRSRVDICQM